MSSSCSDCFSVSNLLCGEESSSINISSRGGDHSPECSSDFKSRLPGADESIAGLLECERDVAGISSGSSVHPIDASVRAEFVAWILKVQRHYGFQPLTAYLAVNYFDRFLHCHQLPKMSGWPLQLLSVACLSLAAKMEEPLVPSLFDLQVEDSIFIFEPRTIQRMELLVLRVLDWRLRFVSPISYLPFFSVKIDPSRVYAEFIATTAKEIIFLSIQEASLIECRPSCIAAAAILSAANDLPKFSLVTAQHAQSWCVGLHQNEIMSCRRLIGQEVYKTKAQKQMEPIPKLKFTSTDSSSCSSSSSSTFKRRKLSSNSWTDDNEGTSRKRVGN